MKLLKVIFLGCVICLTFNGCSTSSTNIAYKTEVASVITVEAAVAGYRAAVKQGLIDENQRILAQKAFDRWKAAEILAIDISANSAQSSTVDAFKVAEIALNDFISLLKSFNISVK